MRSMRQMKLFNFIALIRSSWSSRLKFEKNNVLVYCKLLGELHTATVLTKQYC